MKRHRSINEGNQGKKFHTKYYIPVRHDDGILYVVPACQATFLRILQVSRSRVKTVIRNFMQNIKSLKENRGELREKIKKVSVAKENAIIRFVKSLKV